MAFGLIFDVDGVIADSESLIAQATIEMFRDLYGVEFTPEDFRPFIGTGSVRYTAGPAENAGISIDLQKAIDTSHANFARLLTTCESIALPGVHRLIDEVCANPDWRLAIATSSPRDKSEATLKAARIDTSKFSTWITGDMIRRPKPDAEIYVTAALAMSLPPTRCIVIEDSVNGVKAAKDACMKCVAVTNSFPADRLGRADRIVTSVSEINLGILVDVLNEGANEQITWGARLRTPS